MADVSPGAVPDLVTLVFKPVGYLHYFHLKRETNDPLFERQMLPTHGVNKPCGGLDVGRVSFVHHGPLAAFECGCHGQRQLLLSHNCAVIGGTWHRVRGQGRGASYACTNCLQESATLALRRKEETVGR